MNVRKKKSTLLALDTLHHVKPLHYSDHEGTYASNMNGGVAFRKADSALQELGDLQKGSDLCRNHIYCCSQ